MEEPTDGSKRLGCRHGPGVRSLPASVERLDQVEPEQARSRLGQIGDLGHVVELVEGEGAAAGHVRGGTRAFSPGVPALFFVASGPRNTGATRVLRLHSTEPQPLDLPPA